MIWIIGIDTVTFVLIILVKSLNEVLEYCLKFPDN